MARVFLVEDHEFIREGISEYLQIEQFEVSEFGGAAGVLERVRRDAPDLIILDVMLPDGNGFMLARDIRSFSDVPIIFLTAKESESDRLTGFEIGCDDYVVKPFSTKELVMRAKALLKRTGDDNSAARDRGHWTLAGHELRIEGPSHSASLDGQPLSLTGSEWEILSYLAFRSGRVVAREVILTDCLEYFHEGPKRTVDTHIANLRAKLGDVEWIETVRGYGYRFAGEPQ